MGRLHVEEAGKSKSKTTVKLNGSNAGNGKISNVTLSETNNELVGKNLELDKLRRELRLKNDSEDQMRQVLKEYEKTISDLIMEKENEKKKKEIEIENAVNE